MTRTSISIFLLVVGLVWAVVASGFVALLAGFFGNAPPWDSVVIAKLLGWFSWVFVGPLLLIAGATLVLIRAHEKAGSILSLIACFILTALVGYQTLETLFSAAEPLIMKPSYRGYAIAVILTVLADTGAVRLYRLASLAVVQEK
jgi:hypothetical protein